MKQRLNKLIAQSGFCSRRKADELILDKQVRVNGKTVIRLGVLADPESDKIAVCGKNLHLEKKVYIMLHKPKGYVSTTKDAHAEKTVLELIPELPVRIFPVGRLDKDTSGLLFLTNDGDISYKLTHPRFEVDRVYEVLVRGFLDDKTIKKIEHGNLPIDDYVTCPCRITMLSRSRDKTSLHINLHEGKKRQIRKIFMEFTHPVIALKRIQFGKVKLGDLKIGSWKYLKKSQMI